MFFTTYGRVLTKVSVMALLILAFWQPVQGAPVDAGRAMRVAKGFWNENPQCGDVKSMVDVSGRIGLNGIYVFEVNGGEGFVMVAGDDRLRPILAYGNGGEPLRPNVRKWLRWYEAQIGTLAGSEYEASDKVTAEWQRLSGRVEKRTARKSVAKMLTTEWDQYPLYNNMCPYDEEAGDNAVTGCSATATAQVMKYWNHPPVGQGSHSYNEDDFGTLAVDFGSAHYEWDIMPDRLTYSSTSEEIDAVAKLMYHVGVSIEMDYSVEGSGAYTISYGGWTSACSEVALVDYFDYKPTIQGLDRYYYDDDDWCGIIKEELDHGRPVVYTGADSTGGHAFVCDGYDDQMYFHMNWGWSGSLDGYFRLDSLVLGWGGVGSNESISFNYDQTALIGIEPNEDALRVTPEVFNNVASGGNQLSAMVRTNSSVSEGWQLSSDAAWVTVSPTSGAGGGEVSQITINVGENTEDDNRTAHITITQGSETEQITINQRGTLDLQNGWVGNGESLWEREMDKGAMAIICSERFGSYRSTDRVTKVRFVTTRDDWYYPGYDNDTFSIRIYRNPTHIEDIADMHTWLAVYSPENYMGDLVYEQVYVQSTPGDQVVTLDTPYQIGTGDFWIGVYCHGKSLLMYDYTDQCEDKMTLDEYPNVDCALANYRYLIKEKYYDTEYDALSVSYVVFCDNDECDTVVQGNVDFALSFYVDTPNTGIAIAAGSEPVRVYPNPTSGKVYVDGDGIVRVEMLDMNGKRVAEWNHGGRIALPMTSKGMYVLRISTATQTEVQRIVVK